MSERNGELPAGWRIAKLGDVCVEDRRTVEGRSEEAKQLRYLSLEHIESESGRILGEPNGPVQDQGVSTTFAFDERHVLYGKLRPYLNKVALPNFSGRCTTEIIPLLPTNDIAREYLAYFLRRDTTVDAAMRGRTGSRMPRADMKALRQIEIPLPPLDEQQRIEARLRQQLSSLAEARAALEAQLAAAESLPAAHLRAVFESPELQHSPQKRLGDVCGFVGGMQPPKGTFKYAPAEGYVRLVQIQDFRRSDVPVYIQADDSSRRFNEDDVMIGRYGPPLFQILRGLSGAYNVALIKTVPSELLFKGYLYFLLKERRIQNAVIAQSQRAAGQTGVQKEFLESLIVPIPTLSDQRVIAARLEEEFSASRRLREMLRAKLFELEKLPGALLRSAFNPHGD
jgi:type I restriction enzyme S subunit